jgi:Domain of unknown function (DUF1707)
VVAPAQRDEHWNSRTRRRSFMPEPHLRAGDVDRDAVARRLGEHMAAGRLTVAEYEERVGRAYAAKTYGDLAELTADLPATEPTRALIPRSDAPRSAVGPCGAGPWVGGGPRGWGPSTRAAWAGWFSTALVVLTIWLVTSVAMGGFVAFWPIWVIGPWGAMLFARTVRGTPPRGEGGRTPPR